MTTLTEIFGPPISVYTRRQAIEDGILVDCMQDELGRDVAEAGIRYPIAMTATAFGLAVWPILDYGEDTNPMIKLLESLCQDPKGRWWDVLTMLKHAIRRSAPGDRVIWFRVRVVTGKYGNGRPKSEDVRLKAICGPADDGSPCITIMLPDED